MEEKLMAITLEELAKEVQKLKDIEEIKVLKARYSDMCDSNHDWTQIKDLFAPDAKWIAILLSPGAAATTAKRSKSSSSSIRLRWTAYPASESLVTTPWHLRSPLQMTGVHATGKWHMFGAFRMFEGRAETGSKSFLEQGKYEDEYVKIDENGNLDPNGKWFISQLSFWDTLCASPQDGWDDKVIQW